VRFVVAVVLASIGALCLVVPAAENAGYRRGVVVAEREFAAWVDDGLFAYLVAENERLFRTGQAELVDAFAYEQPSGDLARFGLVDDRIGFVRAPTAGIDLPVYLGANRPNLARGAVHLTQTSYPVGGPDTNAVIAAHRGGTLTMFRNIHRLAIGDEVTFTGPGGRLAYRVVETAIIAPDDVGRVRIQPGRDLLTLVSCHPLGRNEQRYVVYAERVL